MKRLKKSVSNLLIFSVLTITMLSGCGEKTTRVSFSWWGKEERHEYTQRGIELFEEKHDGVKVEPRFDLWADFQKKYDSDIKNGTEADVMQINYDWLLKYSEDGKGYYDLNQLTNQINLNGFKNAELGMGMMRGKLNAIPVSFNTNILYYNRTVFEKYGLLGVPRTWDELFKAAEVMDGESYPLMMSDKNLFFMAVAFTEQQVGKPIFDDKGTINFTRQELEQLILAAANFVEKKVTPPGEEYSTDLIESGKAAGYVGWVTEADIVAKGAMDKGDEIVPGDFPGAYLHERSGYYLKPAMLFAIKKDTKHPKEAAAFLDYLINDSYFASIQNCDRGIPINDYVGRYVDRSAQPLQYTAYLKMESDEERMQMEYPGMEDADAIEAFAAAYKSVLNGGSAIDAAKELTEKWEEIFAGITGP